jgi:hypothetical protein
MTGAPVYLFGETGAQIINRAIVCFPEFSIPLAVLLPESFRGGCSFGAVPDRRVRCHKGAARDGSGRSLPQGGSLTGRQHPPRIGSGQARKPFLCDRAERESVMPDCVATAKGLAAKRKAPRVQGEGGVTIVLELSARLNLSSSGVSTRPT